MQTRRLLFAGMALLGAVSSHARAWTVDPSGGGDFTTIQEAVEASADGDAIRVLPGAYIESIDLLGKAVEIFGEGGAERTLVDAGGSGSAVRIRYTPGGIPRIAGITLSGGNGTILRDRDGRFGGGALVELAAPVFEECVIKGNSANSGGGIFVAGGAPRFIRCRIEANSAGAGGGIGLDQDGGASFERCEVRGNLSVFGGGADLFRSRAIFDGTRFIGNRSVEGGGARLIASGQHAVVFRQALFAGNAAAAGGALLVRGASVILTESTVASNESGLLGGSLEIESGTGRVEKSIVAFDRVGAAARCDSFDGEISCCVYAGGVSLEDLCGTLDRVLVADPLFCDADGGDFSLRSDSPCVPGQGPAGCGRIGLYGVGCAPPTPTRSETWGGIRTLFR